VIYFTLDRSLIQRISGENTADDKSDDGSIGANKVIKKLRHILNSNRAFSSESERPRRPAEELIPNGLKM
jgi:hypothetical protein